MAYSTPTKKSGSEACSVVKVTKNSGEISNATRMQQNSNVLRLIISHSIRQFCLTNTVNVLGYNIKDKFRTKLSITKKEEKVEV
jgi:hypothetical protein